MPCLIAAATVSCSPDESRQVRRCLARYFDAVQSGDEGRIAALLAGCAGREAACRAEMAALDAAVTAQRELGSYRFEPGFGFGLVRALVLGRGGFWTLRDVRRSPGGEPDRVVAIVHVKTHYRPDESRGLPRGARVELLVEPLGRVLALERGVATPAPARRQLVELDIRATLVRGRAGGDPPWRVAGLEVVPGSAVFEVVAWRPE